MKVIFSSLVVVFAALLIVVIPSSDAVSCMKVYGCINKITDKRDEVFGLRFVDCGECVGWGCYYDNILYYGTGCNGDDNICKIGNNQNVPEYNDGLSLFVSCNNKATCAMKLFHEKKKQLNHSIELSDGYCDPLRNRSKNGVFICEKQNTCETKSYKAVDMVSDDIDCDECAGWGCIINNTLYTGYGCKGDNNICKAGNNQNESEKYEDSSWFVTCNNFDRCASGKLSKFMMKENGTFSKEAYNHVGECNPYGLKYVLESTCKQLPNNNQLSHTDQLSGKTTKANPNKNEAKTGGVFTIAVIVLLGCIFTGF